MKENLNVKIGNLIRDTRLHRGLTQAELAARLKTSQSAINRIEKGKQNLSLETIARISEVLDRSLFSIKDETIDLRVRGGRELKGQIKVKSSKNAAVSILAASLLNKGTTKIKSIAKIEEVNRILEVFESIGVRHRWLGNDLEIKRPDVIDIKNINHEAAVKTRAAIMIIGAMMHESSYFEIPYAGGCKLGKRSIIPHLYALEELGLSAEIADDHYKIYSKPQPAQRDIIMYESGDTATANAIIAAAKTPGQTVIKFASANYQVQDLCFFLRKLGVKVKGVGTTTLTIEGVEGEINRNVAYAPSEDPVEAMTFVTAAIATNSQITVKGCPVDFMELEMYKLEKMGLRFAVSQKYKAQNTYTNLADITIMKHNGQLTAPVEKIYGRPFPGLNIDHLPYFVLIAALADGQTLIHDWVYEDRAIHYMELKKLGIQMELADTHRVLVSGPNKLHPADIMCPPALRPAVVLLLGMLNAEGTSTLRNVYTIHRGYEQLAERLNALGADIEILKD